MIKGGDSYMEGIESKQAKIEEKTGEVEAYEIERSEGFS